MRISILTLASSWIIFLTSLHKFLKFITRRLLCLFELKNSLNSRAMDKKHDDAVCSLSQHEKSKMEIYSTLVYSHPKKRREYSKCCVVLWWCWKHKWVMIMMNLSVLEIFLSHYDFLPILLSMLLLVNKTIHDAHTMRHKHLLIIKPAHIIKRHT